MRRRFDQLNLSEDDEISISFVKDVPKKAYVPETPRLAVDLGLGTLRAVDKGALTGNGFFEVFQRPSRFISELDSNRPHHRIEGQKREMLLAAKLLSITDIFVTE
ncbi:MAG: hypothetical protein ABR903_10975 [Thermodesulfovibrionales bacterium]|jgi:hypothetical protein